MAKSNHYYATLPIALFVALSASAGNVPTISPDLYGKLKGKTITPLQQLQPNPQAPAASRGPLKLQAYANDGNALVDQIGDLFLVDQEDFSLLTTGSEEEPDFDTDLAIEEYMTDPDTGMILRDENGNPIPNPDFEYPWNNMKPEYITGNGGWGVGNAYPAGGMLYFSFGPGAEQGKISTPWLDLSAYGGTFVLEFKVKITEAAANAEQPTMILVETAETNNMGPSWDIFEDAFVNYQNISTEWTTFRLLFQGAGPSTLCNIVGMGLDGGMFIDDIKIYSLRPFLATPVLRRHSEFTENSFVANWDPVEGAEKYIFDLWYDDLYGERHMLADKLELTENSYKVEGTNLDDIYFYNVQAVNSEHESLIPSHPREVFDIITPKMRKATLLDEDANLFEGGVEEVISAFGYNYFVQRKRVAEADGEFVLTHETFDGWSHPDYEDGWNYTKENPVDDKVVGYYFPTDLKQQGWYGENFQIYKDYLCLVPFFYEASLHQEQTAWVSPEFDLSRDGGKVKMSMKLASSYDVYNELYSHVIVGLFNWNEEIQDYEQVELVYCKDLTFDWQTREIELTKGSARSKIAIFGAGSYQDVYIDDIVISQNLKKGDVFMDPFFFRTWQLGEVMADPSSFEFEVPDHAQGYDIYQKAQAARIHYDANGRYDGEAFSGFAADDYIASMTSGIRLTENGLTSNIRVADGKLYITNPNGEEVSIAKTDGISRRLGNAAEITCSVPSNGIVIVTIGNKATKIAL